MVAAGPLLAGDGGLGRTSWSRRRRAGGGGSGVLGPDPVPQGPDLLARSLPRPSSSCFIGGCPRGGGGVGPLIRRRPGRIWGAARLGPPGVGRTGGGRRRAAASASTGDGGYGRCGARGVGYGRRREDGGCCGRATGLCLLGHVGREMVGPGVCGAQAMVTVVTGLCSPSPFLVSDAGPAPP